MKTKKTILFIDIETSYYIGYTWGPKWEASIIEFAQDRIIMSFAYKWNGERTRVVSLTKQQALNLNDKPLIIKIRDLLNQADIVVAQNGDSFDIKIINTRLLLHKIPPPSPYRTIDTLKIARSRFAFNSNRLDDVVKLLGEGEKFKHRGFEMWKKCLSGDTKALRDMRRYNKRDVDILYKYYLRIRPWIKNHPATPVDENNLRCVKCSSLDVQNRGYMRSLNMQYKRYYCKSCKSWLRGVSGERYTQLTSV